jgi:hypothetical protein
MGRWLPLLIAEELKKINMNLLETVEIASRRAFH